VLLYNTVEGTEQWPIELLLFFMYCMCHTIVLILLINKKFFILFYFQIKTYGIRWSGSGLGFLLLLLLLLIHFLGLKEKN
jgi:hypothetical protein